MHELFVYGPLELHNWNARSLHKYKTQLFPKSCVLYLPNTIFEPTFCKTQLFGSKSWTKRVFILLLFPFLLAISYYLTSTKIYVILSIRFFILLPINNSQIQIEISVWCRLGTLWHAIIWFFLLSVKNSNDGCCL